MLTSQTCDRCHEVRITPQKINQEAQFSINSMLEDEILKNDNKRTNSTWVNPPNS
jgi:NMD protein affecting ribosome stability and mRNA decay